MVARTGHGIHGSPRYDGAIKKLSLWIGTWVSVEQIQDLLSDKEVHVSELTHEVERATLAVQSARAGRRVCIVSSGDAGIYGMAGLVLDILSRQASDPSDPLSEPDVEVVPGISALNAAASLLRRR